MKQGKLWTIHSVFSKSVSSLNVAMETHPPISSGNKSVIGAVLCVVTALQQFMGDVEEDVEDDGFIKFQPRSKDLATLHTYDFQNRPRLV